MHFATYGPYGLKFMGSIQLERWKEIRIQIYLERKITLNTLNVKKEKEWAVVVAQLVKGSLPTPEVRGSIPDISKVFIE